MSEPSDVTFGQGQTLFRQGDKGGELYFIKSGKVELSVRNEKGESAIIAVLGERAVLGTMSFLEGDLRSATAVTLAETKVVVVNQVQREKLLKTIPSWFAVLVKDLSSNLRRLNQEFATLRAENEQLTKRLAALKRKHGDAEGDAPAGGDKK